MACLGTYSEKVLKELQIIFLVFSWNTGRRMNCNDTDCFKQLLEKMLTFSFDLQVKIKKSSEVRNF